MGLELIIGLAVMCFLFLYFSFQLSDDHFLLKLILIFFFIATSMIIPSAVINNDCSMLVANYTENDFLVLAKKAGLDKKSIQEKIIDDLPFSLESKFRATLIELFFSFCFY